MTVTDDFRTARDSGKPYIFHYEKPPVGDKKITTSLCRTDHGDMLIQVCNSGGENNLHAHPHNDGFWFLLKGAARFYTDGDHLLGELHEGQGILMPRGFRYWFEYVANENHDDLELLRCYVSDYDELNGRPDGPTRINYEPIKAVQGDGARNDPNALNAF